MIIKNTLYIALCIMIFGTIVHAGEEISVDVADFIYQPITINVKKGDTYQKIINTLNEYTRFAHDITYAHLESGKNGGQSVRDISLTEQFNASSLNDSKNITFKVSRHWHITPIGTLLEKGSSFTIPIDHYELVQNVKKKIKKYITEQKLAQANLYYTIAITHKGKILDNQHRMPSYRKPFNENEYKIELNEIERPPQLTFINNKQSETTLLTVVNFPSNIWLRDNNNKPVVALQNVKFNISTLDTKKWHIRIVNNEKSIIDTVIDSPAEYTFYQEIMNAAHNHYDSQNRFNEFTYTATKELFSACAQNVGYSLFESGYKVPVPSTMDHSIEIIGSAYYTTCNALIDAHKNHTFNDIIAIYKQITDLAPDITVVLKSQASLEITDLEKKIPLTEPHGKFYTARFSRNWDVAPQGTVYEKSIQPFTIRLREKETIITVKKKILEAIHNTDKNLKSQPFIVTIAKNGKALHDNDTMPLYIEKFNPNKYTVTLATSYDPFITDDPKKLPLSFEPKAQQPTPIGKPAPAKPASPSLWQYLASWFSWSQKSKK